MWKYCVITLRSVFVQGIRALDTLSPYIYYELLVLPMLVILNPAVTQEFILLLSVKYVSTNVHFSWLY